MKLENLSIVLDLNLTYVKDKKQMKTHYFS